MVSQLLKRTKKSHPESDKAPKPSTPRKSYVKKTPKCSRRPLFVDDEHSVSLPFLIDSKNEQVEFENSTIRNEFGIEYNSLQSYQKINSLLGLCLVESRRTGGNFPYMCKKKRMSRHRLHLQKLLTPFAKAKRSNSFIRKKKCWTNFYVEGSYVNSKNMRFLIKKIISMKKKIHQKTKKRVYQKKKKLDVHKKSGEIVLYKRPSFGVDVILDEETLRVWNLLVAERGHEENDEQKRTYWEKIRNTYHKVIKSFLDEMRDIQGMFSLQ